MPNETQVAESTDTGPSCPNSVLGKAQLLLGAFGNGTPRLKLAELSRRSGVPKASAYRLSQELVHWGLLARDGDFYQLGVRMFELGQRAPVSGMLRTVARPLLADLFATTRAAIHLAVLDGTDVLYLEKFAGAANVQFPAQAGGRLPASCTSCGKVLLALSAEGPQAMRDVERNALARPTSRTVASTTLLRRQLALITEQGYAVEVEEVLPKYGAIAVPVLDPAGSAYAAVAATVTLDQLAVKRLLPELRLTAAAIAKAVHQNLWTSMSRADAAAS